MLFKYFLLGVALLSSQGYSAPFIYIVDNSVPPGTGRIAVLDQNTFMPIAGSPFVNQPMAAGEQVQIAISPDGTRLYVPGFLASDSVSVMDIDPNTGAITNVQNFTQTAGAMNLPFNQPFGVAIGSDGSVYVTNFGAMASSIYKMDRDLNYIADIVTPFQNLASIVINSTDTYLYCVSTGNSMILRLDAGLSGFIATPSGGTNPYICAIHPDDTFVYATHISGEVSKLNPDLTGLLTVTPMGSSSPIGMAFDPDGSRIYVANSGGGGGTTLLVLDTSTLATAIPAIGSGGNAPFVVAVDPDGERLYNTNAASGNLYIRDIVHDTYPFVYDTGPIFGVPYGIVFTPASELAGPVRNLTLTQFKNDFGVIYEYVNKLQWQAPSSSQVAGYYVYKDFALIATLNANETEYNDHNIKPKTRIVYSIVSFDADGNLSDPVDLETK